MNNSVKFNEAISLAVNALLKQRNSDGLWHGNLSSSAVSTAVALLAIYFAKNAGNTVAQANCLLISKAAVWLETHQNEDGGWGDSDSSPTNLTATLLARAALACASNNSKNLDKASQCVSRLVGGDNPAAIYTGVIKFYGDDLTFSTPILFVCALSGHFGDSCEKWKYVPNLPFELALIPQCLFKYLKLPVVSYAIPALIAVGFARRSMTASNRIIRRFYGTIINILLQKLCRMQPSNGGFLEAAPLTGFVAVCLSVAGYGNHAVVSRAISFLANTARTDGSWAIDTDLTIWLTSNAVRSISSLSVMTENDKLKLGEQFRDFQFKTTHPFTLSAPGGWAWTNLPGGVPDADDTSSVLNALAILQPERCDSSIENGLRWLLNMQNSDGGIPTFCRGWGFLPFDRSSPDISVHTLIAFYNWRKWLKSRLAIKIDCACVKIIRYLERVQNNDGSWNPLWFGDQNSAGQHNPVYGTGIVVDILTAIGYEGESLNRGVNYLCVSQNSDGGWGGALGTKSNIECTAIAATALCSFPNCRNNVAAACALLCDAVIESAENIPPASPIGLYFAALWYDEKLYPLLFVVRFFNKYLTVIHH